MILTIFVLFFISFQFMISYGKNNFFAIKLFKANDGLSNILASRETSSIPQEQTGNVLLTHINNSPYWGQIKLGTPGQIFNLSFDTSSMNFWVVSSRHSSRCQACFLHTKYNHRASSTYMSNGTNFKSRAISGAIEGFFSIDTLQIGDVHIQNQVFGEATRIPRYYMIPKYAGTFGLAFSQSQNLPYVSPFVHAIKQGIISPAISFYFSRNQSDNSGGEIIFGGVNTKYMKGNFYSTPVVSAKNWVMKVKKVNFKNHTICRYCKAQIDSITSTIIGPKKEIDKIHELMEAQKNSMGFYLVNCSRIGVLPDLDLVFENFTLRVSPEGYLTKFKFNNEELCMSGFSVRTVPSEDYDFIFGINFKSSFYVRFKYSPRTIDFAMLSDPKLKHHGVIE